MPLDGFEPPPDDTEPRHGELVARLVELYSEQLLQQSVDYLVEHGSPAAID